MVIKLFIIIYLIINFLETNQDHIYLLMVLWLFCFNYRLFSEKIGQKNPFSLKKLILKMLYLLLYLLGISVILA